MSKSIGIDLGTTNSVAAIKTLDVEIITNSEGDELTPSVVSYSTEKNLFFNKNSYVVGKNALEWKIQDPQTLLVQ